MTPTSPPADSRAGLLAVLLIVLLAVHLPAFVCMPPDYDVVQWDLDARTVLTGGSLYRDVMENNLPGMLVFQAPIRWLFGWRSEVIRLADAVVIGACVWLLVRRLPTVATRCGSSLVLVSFYLTTSEWCHAQRDSWMLLPALVAMTLRGASCDNPIGGHRVHVVAWGVVEGLLWGMAVWVKPYTILPAVACWLSSVGIKRRGVMLDATGLLIGGLTAGGFGLAWLGSTGAWADFWDVMLVWNREYVRFDTTAGSRTMAWAGLAIRFFPWILAHLVAVPLAVARLGGIAKPTADRDTILLSALYLGWLAQAVLLQHLFDYPHVPPLLLALALICREIARPASGRAWILLTIFLVFCMVIRLTPLTASRLPLVVDCLHYGSTPVMRDRLSMLGRVDWQALAEVADFVKSQGMKDGELASLNMGPAVLYLELDLRPPTRYVVLQNNLAVFAKQHGRIFDELARSRQRFLVVDVEIAMWKAKPPPAADRRVVFEAGRYRVYALNGEETAGWVRAHMALPNEN